MSAKGAGSSNKEFRSQVEYLANGCQSDDCPDERQIKMSNRAKKSRRRKGRPRSLDHAKREVIIALVSVGCTRTFAARYLGVSPQTIFNTAQRDEEFKHRIERAAANVEVDHLSTVTTASKRTWQASAWVLERLDPERFADPKSRVGRRQVLKRFRDAVFQILNDEELEASLLLRLKKRIQQACNKSV